MNKSIISALIVGLSLISSSVIAEETDMSATATPDDTAVAMNDIDQIPNALGWYASLNAGIAVTGDITKNGVTRSGFGRGALLAYGGYQFNENWAAEFGLSYQSIKNGDYEIYDLAGKLTLPMDDKNILFGKLGVALASLEYCQGGCQRDNKFAPFIGVGYGYQVMPNLQITAEYNGVFVTSGMADGSLGAMTVGATYYFIN